VHRRSKAFHLGMKGQVVGDKDQGEKGKETGFALPSPFFLFLSEEASESARNEKNKGNL
jgi:hypothetical protein